MKKIQIKPKSKWRLVQIRNQIMLTCKSQIDNDVELKPTWRLGERR